LDFYLGVRYIQAFEIFVLGVRCIQAIASVFAVVILRLGFGCAFYSSNRFYHVHLLQRFCLHSAF
jgi:hypothetical protein